MSDPRNSRDEANDAIVRALFDTGLPVATEFFGGFHWIVVCGALTDVRPLPGTPYELYGFFINLPTLPPAPAEQQHRDDDLCGRAQYRGALHEFVSMADWNRSFRLNSTQTFVNVTARRRVDPVVDNVLSEHVDFGAALDPKQSAMDGIASNQLASQGPLKGLLVGAVATAVTRIRKQNAYYVTMTQNGLDVGYARVTDNDGTFLGAMVTEPGQLHPILTPAQIAVRIENEELAFDGERIRLSADSFVVDEPFWRPCREAPSPYYPLYEVQVRTKDGTKTVYSTAEGCARTSLMFYDADRTDDLYPGV